MAEPRLKAGIWVKAALRMADRDGRSGLEDIDIMTVIQVAELTRSDSTQVADYAIVSPPDTLIVWPVMYSASSDSRNAIIPA